MIKKRDPQNPFTDTEKRQVVGFFDLLHKLDQKYNPTSEIADSDTALSLKTNERQGYSCIPQDRDFSGQTEGMDG